MPGPDITPPKNSRALSFSLFLKYAIWAGAVAAVLAQPFAGHAAWQTSPLQSEAAHSASAQSQPAPPQSPSGAAPAPPATTSPQQPTEQDGTFVIRTDVDEVLLHATVVDDRQHIVTNLDRNAFTVFEDGKPQNVVSFRHEDIPVAMPPSPGGMSPSGPATPQTPGGVPDVPWSPPTA